MVNPNLGTEAEQKAAFDAEALRVMGESDQPGTAGAAAPVENAPVVAADAGSVTDPAAVVPSVTPPIDNSPVDHERLEREAIQYLEGRGKLEKPGEAAAAEPESEYQRFQRMQNEIPLPPELENAGYQEQVSYRAFKMGEMAGKATAQQENAPIMNLMQQAGAAAEAKMLSGELVTALGGAPESAPAIEAALKETFGEKLPAVLTSYRAGADPALVRIVQQTAELALVKSRTQKVANGGGKPADAEPVGGGGTVTAAPLNSEEKGFAEALKTEIARRGTEDDAKDFGKKVRY